ncbi:MAG: hypothetical protein K5765_04020 [Clostridia bacterium]|nr:hypothetical protein [Clostridia bacterium]
MSIELTNHNELIIHIPNSEASVDAQHHGIKNTTVGSYYMSEMQPAVISFLNNFEGEYYIDLNLSLKNAKIIFEELLQKNLSTYFKSHLIAQKTAMDVFDWYINEYGPYYLMPRPSVNENNKYLKFDNLDNMVSNFRTLCLGELTDIHIKKVGINGYIIYLEKTPKYSQILEKNIFNWVEK